MTEEIKKAEQRGYSRGYQAGKARRKRERMLEQYEQRKNAFWQRAYLAILQDAFNAHGWKSGDKPITSVDDRTNLARNFADSSLNIAVNQGKI
jgi:hypothetical protein